MSRLDLEEAATWLELAATVARLPATGLLARLRNGDEGLAEAIVAIMEAERSPSQRLDAVRDFLVMHTLGETWDPATDVQQALWRPETSPFQVPPRFLDVWFKPTPDEMQRGKGIEASMRIRQYYDSLDLSLDMLNSTRLFGNSNIGNARQTNLQASGQLTIDDTPTLLTSWWITTAPWPRADEFFAKTWLTMVVGGRPEAMTIGLELLRRRQTVLVPVPERQNFEVRFDLSYAHEDVYPRHAPPLYVFVEGWGRRRTQ